MSTKFTIRFENLPMEALSFPGLQKIEKKDGKGVVTNAPSGGISDSEVGKPIYRWTPFGMAVLMKMRGERKRKWPFHLWGKASLGDAFSIFHTDIISLPAEGVSVDLDPHLSFVQDQILGNYNAIQGDAIFILRVDEPLGASHLLHVSCPEFDNSAITRGFRWKPTLQPVVACFVPWSSDLNWRRRDTIRLGSSGLTLRVNVIEDNSTEAVSTPIKMTVWSCFVNVAAAGYNGHVQENVELPRGFQRTIAPAPKQPDNVREAQFDEEVKGVADGDVQEKPEVISAEAPSDAATESKIPAEAPAPRPGKPVAKSTGKPDNRQMQARWIYHSSYALDENQLGLEYKIVNINPSRLTKKGDSIARSYRRNVWTAGENKLGFAQGLRVRVVSNRPPQIAGLVEFTCNRVPAGMFRWFHEIGTATEFILGYNLFMENTVTDRSIRSLNSPWLRTSAADMSFTWRLVSFNHTTEIKSVRMNVYVAPGGSNFSVPLKPLAPLPAVIQRPMNFDLDKRATLLWCADRLLSRFTSREQQMDSHENVCPDSSDIRVANAVEPMTQQINPAQFGVAPAGTQGYESGEIITGEAEPEDLDASQFWVRLPDVMIKPNEPVAINLNLSLIQDKYGTLDLNTISERFERYAHVVPMQAGEYGPIIGEYKLVPRVPTNFAANLKHVCLPGDMNLDAASFIFGLSDILGIAGSAISSIGGPLLQGAIDTIGGIANTIIPGATDIIGSIPIIGDVISGITGKSDKAMGSAAPAEQAVGTSQSPPAIGGKIPISRFLTFLKQVQDNETANPAFGQLLLELVDALGSVGVAAQDESIPMAVYVRMNSAMFERSVIDREFVPMDYKDEAMSLPLTLEEVAVLALELANSKKVEHNRYSVKLMAMALTADSQGQESVDVAKQLVDQYTLEDSERILADFLQS